MRFLMLVYNEGEGTPSAEQVEAMSRFNEELTRAGALLALDGLHPPAAATRVSFTGEGRASVIDGPFAEAKELVGGYWIIQARSKKEAVEWASRAPLQGGTIEVRQIAEAEDYAQDVQAARTLSEQPPEQTTST